MPSLGEFLAGLGASVGPVGLLLALFVIFAVDALLFPALPEVFAVFFFSVDTSLGWGVLVLAAALAGEQAGNLGLYVFVKHGLVAKQRMPAKIERAMRRYVDFLVVTDERMILVNRVAPVVPLMGAFIATLGWRIRRSLAYIFVGGLAKYTLLLALVGYFHWTYSRDVALQFTLAAVIAVVALSFVASLVYRRRRAAAPKPD